MVTATLSMFVVVFQDVFLKTPLPIRTVQIHLM
jgi:hypothetical protein